MGKTSDLDAFDCADNKPLDAETIQFPAARLDKRTQRMDSRTEAGSMGDKSRFRLTSRRWDVENMAIGSLKPWITVPCWNYKAMACSDLVFSLGSC
ncbi:hypothetical protein AVEN_74465-1 [Araneus ventricosus]|uniref:Uncharacterized protein n=1 Tax=Araneus ventricosus TaxID=182803 RepID=A0A4Y2PW48_ARAVE|nr:hypothetical protein AVEN_74465-1 [Araneus ventricosus]